MKVSNCTNRPLVEPCNLDDINYQIDTYIGCEHYCYYCYALQYAETNWSEEIKTHRDIEEKIRNELENIPPQTIYLGYHSDPYQPMESELFQTRKTLELLLKNGFSASILTKSNLVVRDIDLLKEMPNANVSISVAFDNDEIRNRFEGNTINTDDRIEALRLCKEAGIGTSALVCPVIPVITDTENLISKLEYITEKIWIYGISLQNRKEECSLNVENILMLNFSNEAEEIESIIYSKNHSYWVKLRNKLKVIKERQNLDLRINL